MAKTLRAENLTYSPFEKDFATADVYEVLKNEVGNEHASELIRFKWTKLQVW